MDLGLIGLVFATIFLVELPDKTFIATLVLSTRYRPLTVWAGVAAAFLVQTLVAVAAGRLLSLLPREPIMAVALVIFLVGAVLLFRAAPGAGEAERDQEEEFAAKAADPRTGWRVLLTSFVVLFTAEWGDLSQLLTASLAARYDDPVAVFLGAWTALVCVSGLAVLAGRVLLRWISLRAVHYLGATVCLVLAGLTAYELLA